MTEQRNQPKRKLVELAELEPLLREVLDSGGTFRITVTGTSNLPTLHPDRDSVVLAKANQPLRKLDLPLYRRASGQYVLHRIVSVQKDGSYTCCGDNQWTKEPGIRLDQVIGYVVGIRRNGREFSALNKRYRLWVRIWVFLLPCRRFLIRLCHAVRRVFCRGRSEANAQKDRM